MIDLCSPEAGLEQMIAAQASTESQDPRAVRTLVQRALDSEPVQEACECDRWKEMFISADVEGVLLEGYIDLLYRRADGNYVVFQANSGSSG